MSVDFITCHILDTTIGKPAAGVACTIYRIADESDDVSTLSVSPEPFGSALTNSDGRIGKWTLSSTVSPSEVGLRQVDNSLTWDTLKPGVYKIKFNTLAYFKSLSDGGDSTAKERARTFFPFIEVHFVVTNPPDKHYHIPLLLSNYSYSTYRGS